MKQEVRGGVGLPLTDAVYKM